MTETIKSEIHGYLLLEVNDVCRKVKFSKTTLYELIKNDGFPKPIKVGAKSVWVEAEIDAWIEAKINSRDSALSCI